MAEVRAPVPRRRRRPGPRRRGRLPQPRRRVRPRAGAGRPLPRQPAAGHRLRAAGPAGGRCVGHRAGRRCLRLARRPCPGRGRCGLRGPVDRGLAARAVAGGRAGRPGVADLHRVAGRHAARGGGAGRRVGAPVAEPGHRAAVVPDRRALRRGPLRHARAVLVPRQRAGPGPGPRGDGEDRADDLRRRHGGAGPGNPGRGALPAGLRAAARLAGPQPVRPAGDRRRLGPPGHGAAARRRLDVQLDGLVAGGGAGMARMQDRGGPPPPASQRPLLTRLPHCPPASFIMGAMPWQELADLPFAAALQAHRGRLAPRGDYDCEHFDDEAFADASAPDSRFLECAFTGVRFTGGALRQARFASAWLRDVAFTGTSLAETEWSDATLISSAWAGVEAFGARLRQVTLHGCKLDAVNFRDAELTEVVFDSCLLREVDFTGATLARTSFAGCRLAATTFTRTTLDKVDLRRAELGITTDATSLRGAIVTSAQLTAMAPVLAESLGIVVDDG